ncbi:MAG: hypothetical protein J1E56_04600 [Ruminococcus sp.]|nr:hypothetical protein [Ruminococcus sp.]
MDNKIEKMIYYSVALKGFEELDFKDDALAGVRACYFKENLKPQQGDTIRQFEEEKLSYCYSLEENKPMLWKVMKNQAVLQLSKYLPENMYCICFYNSQEFVTKKIYFNPKHYWIKTEYFVPEKGLNCVCSVAPKVINGYFAIVKTDYNENGCKATPLYMVTSVPNVDLCDAVAYSNKGMLYFTTQTPNNVSKPKAEVMGFSFSPVDFNLARNLNSTFDISFAPYLTLENGNPVDKSVVEKEVDEIPQNVFDTKDNSEKISEEKSQEISSDYDFSEDNDINIYYSNDFNLKKDDYQIKEKPVSDKKITDGESKFAYYGNLDENGNRDGYGRTETSQGKTAYEGEYKNDMRNGFGCFYYKDGSINYIGDWTDNKRNGRGIGFRSSDGEIHIGKWNDNLPEKLGARFDKDGNFISLNHYLHGNKHGIGITFDQNGNLIVSKWNNNNEVESKIIILGEDNG